MRVWKNKLVYWVQIIEHESAWNTKIKKMSPELFFNLKKLHTTYFLQLLSNAPTWLWQTIFFNKLQTRQIIANIRFKSFTAQSSALTHLVMPADTQAVIRTKHSRRIAHRFFSTWTKPWNNMMAFMSNLSLYLNYHNTDLFLSLTCNSSLRMWRGKIPRQYRRERG